MGPPLANFIPVLEARLPFPVSHSHILCVHIPVQSVMLPAPREHVFLTAKGIMSLGKLLHASCFQHHYHGFPKRLMVSVQLLPL